MEDTKWTNKLLKIKDHIFPFIKMIKYLGKKGQPLKELTESQIISATQLINLIKSGKSKHKSQNKITLSRKRFSPAGILNSVNWNDKQTEGL